VAGIGVYAQVQPLEFISSLVGSRWANLEVARGEDAARPRVERSR
jgi:hypothetical protein